MHPLVLTFAAPFLLLFAWVMYTGTGEEEAAKARARAGPAPAAVKIEDFRASRDKGPSGEVVILAQVDLTQLSDIVFSKNGDEKKRYVLAPLYPVGAADTRGGATALLAERGRLSDAQIKAMTVAQGPIGPVLKLDGELIQGSQIAEALRSDSGERLRVVQGAFYFDPYAEGRDAALAPSTGGRDAAIFIAGLSVVLFVLGIVLQWNRVRRRRAEAEGYSGSVY